MSLMCGDGAPQKTYHNPAAPGGGAALCIKKIKRHYILLLADALIPLILNPSANSLESGASLKGPHGCCTVDLFGLTFRIISLCLCS